MKYKRFSKVKAGQALVEFVLVLPLLLLLIVGTVEIGMAFYSYMVAATANREGVRLAARGVFTDANLVRRILVTSGLQEVDGGLQPRLRTIGSDPNTGIIITHIPILLDENGTTSSLDPSEITVHLSGTIAIDRNTTRPIQLSDSRAIENLGDLDLNIEMSDIINDLRDDGGYNVQDNEIVIIETFVSHDPVLDYPDIFPLPDPLELYFMSTMRVVLSSRAPQTGE